MKKDDQHTAVSADLRRRAEKRLNEQPKSSPDLAAATSDQRLIHELQVHQIELEMQNEELRESRAQAEAARKRYTELYDFAPTGYVTLSPEGSITLSNLATARLLGSDPAKLHGQRFSSFVAVSDRAIFNDLLREVFVGQTQSTCEVTLNSPGHPARIVQIDATPATGDLECQAVLIDITDRKRIEAALIESERFAHNTLDALSANIAILDKSGVILSVNQAWRDFAAMNSASVAGRCEGTNYLQVCESTSRDDRQTALAFANGIRTVIAGTTEEFRLEYPCHSPTEQRWFVGRVTRFRDDGPLRIVVAHTNVTERRLAEESRRESQQFLSDLVNTVDGIVWESDAETLHFSFVSQQAERILGYPVQHWLTESTFWIDHVHPQDRDAALEYCLSEIRQGKSHQFEYRMLSADGREVWLKDIVTVVLKDGVPVTLRGIMVDITAQKLTEAALREHESRLRLLVQSSNVGLWDWNLITNEVFFSPEWKRQLGYSDDELPNRFEKWEQRVHPEDLARTLAAVNDFRAGRRDDYDVEFRLRHKDGSWRCILARAALRHDAVGHPIRMMGCHVDITERKQAEEELRESQAMLELVLDSIPLGVFWKDRNSVYRGANRVSRRAMGFQDSQAVVGRTDYDVLTFQREQAEFFVQKDRQVMQSGQSEFGIVETLTQPDGTTIWLETNKMPMHDSTGNVTGILGTWQDVSERNRATEELSASRERLELLSRQLIATQETERRHLARELHDEIGQALSGIKLNLNALQQATLSPEATSLIHNSIDVVDQSLQQVRNLALDLRPSMLDDIGLVAALRWCLDRQSKQAGFVPHFMVDPSLREASLDVETACFRIAQESLTNITRHAKARNVRVELRQLESELELFIHDDGIGFDVPAARLRATHGASIGVLGMSERTQLLGGHFEIESIPSQGTTIHARIPLKSDST